MDHPDSRSLPAFDLASHGGRLIEARRLFPQAPAPFIDLSTGINPLSYPIPPIAASAWTRLPEPEEIVRLEAIAARAYGAVDGSSVVAVPGTQLLISLLPRLFPHASVAILGPTYGEYARSFEACGSRVTHESAVDALAEAPCAIVCNPNNPDGRRFDAATLLAVARQRGGAGLLVVDESFADLDDVGLSLVPHLPEAGVLVLRSLSKSYGLGGVRLGFALAGPGLSDSIRDALGPWPVSGAAISIGLKALDDSAWREAVKRQLGEDVARLDEMLGRAGAAVVGGTLLFRLAECSAAGSLRQRLGEAGILVRGFDYRPDWLRFGIPGAEDEWRRLAAALGGLAAT